MSDAQVTLVISPRERFSMSERALASIYDNTPEPFELIYVTGGAPDRVYQSLKRESQTRKFELIHSSQYLSPSQSRNLAIPKIKTKYAVFLDNDALVAPGWLGSLVTCAEETGADVVGPLYLIGEFARATIHMAGGMLTPAHENGSHILRDEQFLYDTPIARANTRLKRRECDYVEFHCMLVRTDFFDRTGLLDEALLNLHEERDICLLAKHEGTGVFMEPKSVVTYVAPPPLEWWDLPYFMLRWSEQWSVDSVRHFNKKWHIDAVQHVSDKKTSYEDGTVVGFASAWRSRAAGMHFSCEDAVQDTPTNAEQLQLMVALFASVHREYFDYQITDSSGTALCTEEHRSTPKLIFDLADVTQETDNLQVRIEPLRREQASEPELVRVTGLSSDESDHFRSASLMVLKAGNDLYENWFAINNADTQAKSVLDSIARASGTLLLAGSLEGVGSPARRTLRQAVVGNMLSHAQLQDSNLIALLKRGEVW